MPYQNEKASKSGHSDLVKNPDIQTFLDKCEYMREPTDEEANLIVSTFLPAPTSDTLPVKVVASDASPYSEPIAGKFPSTQVGYVKVSLVLIDLNDYDGLSNPSSQYVDPFKVAAMHRNADAFSFTLPGSNIRYKNSKTVSDGFRLAMWEQLSDGRTKLAKDEGFSVKDTLLDINDNEVMVKKCPSCTVEKQFIFKENNQIELCPECGTSIYMTDSLRIHEQITDYGDCSSAITRFMNVVEHLILATFIRMLAHYQPGTLSNMGFIVDGPLAIFGQPASIHAKLMSLYNKVCNDLNDMGLKPPIIIGLQKSGQVMDHAKSLDRFLPKNVYRVVDDEYRAEHISPSINDNFGHETYYGQDFIFKTNSGKIFTVGIPYPFENKKNRAEFAKEKSNISHYNNLIGRAFDLIRHFEFDLYENAVVPIALAHRHASISLIPGGKVLELVSKHGLAKQA